MKIVFIISLTLIALSVAFNKLMIEENSYHYDKQKKKLSFGKKNI